MTALERIWARPDYNECWPKRLEEEDVEYIRADLAAVQPAQDTTWDQHLAECHCPQPDPRDEVIARLVEAATEALSELEVGGKTMQTVRNLRAALAAAKAVQHG